MAAERLDYEPPTKLRRLRSGLALLGLVAVLGTLTAATLGLLIFGAVSLIDHALA